MAIEDPAAAMSHIQGVWRERIPLAAQMQPRIVRLDASGIEVHAPLAPNRNHMGTGFGGSLNAIALLTGWGLVMALVGEEGATDIVVQESRMRYLRPVTRDFYARCALPDGACVPRLLKSLEQRGRGRLTLAVQVSQAGESDGPLARFDGTFVASRRKPLPLRGWLQPRQPRPPVAARALPPDADGAAGRACCGEPRVVPTAALFSPGVLQARGESEWKTSSA